MADQGLHLPVEEIDRTVDVPLERDGRDVVDDDSEVLFSLVKALLEALPLGDVEEQAGDVCDPAVGITDDVTPLVDPDVIPGLGGDPLLPRVGLAGLQGIDKGFPGGAAITL